MTIEQILDDFEVLDSWDDRYRYVIELGRKLAPLSRCRAKREEQGAGLRQPSLARQRNHPAKNGGGPVLEFIGDSDAHIVKGLIAIFSSLYSGQAAKKILDTDAVALFERLGLREHLTPQRSNGFRSMVERIRTDARTALAQAA